MGFNQSYAGYAGYIGYTDYFGFGIGVIGGGFGIVICLYSYD